MSQPASPFPVEAPPPKSLLNLLRERSPSEILNNLLAVLRAQWYLRHASQVGQRVRVWGHLHVENQGRLTIGSRVRINCKLTPTELVTGRDASLLIGNRVFINYGCSIAALQSITIGDDCSIGTYTIIMDNNYHRIEPDRRNETPPSSPIIIEENVWLGARVTVLPGVTIGRDSVIGAGSVVTRSLPARSLAAGVPARVLRTL